MAQKRTSLKCDNIDQALVWSDRESGHQIFRFPLAYVHGDLMARVFEYGVRQIIADGAAAATTIAERQQMMSERAKQLTDGTWGRAALVDSDIFRAAVTANRIVDSVEARDKWRSLTAQQRRAIGNLPDVKAAMPQGNVEEAEDLLAGF